MGRNHHLGLAWLMAACCVCGLGGCDRADPSDAVGNRHLKAAELTTADLVRAMRIYATKIQTPTDSIEGQGIVYTLELHRRGEPPLRIGSVGPPQKADTLTIVIGAASAVSEPKADTVPIAMTYGPLTRFDRMPDAFAGLGAMSYTPPVPIGNGRHLLLAADRAEPGDRKLIGPSGLEKDVMLVLILEPTTDPIAPAR